MMTILFLLALGSVPGLFWLFYVYQKDRLEPEPVRLILFGGLCGVLASAPVVVLEILLSTSSDHDSIIVAPVVEEGVKFAVVLFFLYRRPQFNEPMDGVIYSAAVALGFASMENGLYLIHESRGGGNVPGLLIARSLLSVPGHMLASTIWGEALGRAKFLDRATRRRVVARGLLLGMGAHALFNFFVFFNLGVAVLMYALWFSFHARIRKMGLLSPFRRRGMVRAERRGRTETRPGGEENPVLSKRILCAGCDGMLELSREEQETGRFTCPLCGAENTRSPTIVDPAGPSEAQPLLSFVVCPSCRTELALNAEERRTGRFVCPECFTPSTPTPDRELRQYVLPAVAQCPMCGFRQKLGETTRERREFTCRKCGEAIEHVDDAPG